MQRGHGRQRNRNNTRSATVARDKNFRVPEKSHHRYVMDAIGMHSEIGLCRLRAWHGERSVCSYNQRLSHTRRVVLSCLAREKNDTNTSITAERGCRTGPFRCSQGGRSKVPRGSGVASWWAVEDFPATFPRVSLAGSVHESPQLSDPNISC